MLWIGQDTVQFFTYAAAILSDSGNLVVEAYQPAAPRLWGNGCKGKHMSFDHILLGFSQIGIGVYCIFKCSLGMCKAMDQSVDVISSVMSVVQKIIVQQCPSYKLVQIDLALMLLIMPITQMRHLDRMVVGTALQMMLVFSHSAKFIRVDNIAYQIIK